MNRLHTGLLTEAEAQLAVDELAEKVRHRGGKLDATLIRNAIVERVTRFLGPGVLPPVVTVTMLKRGGYDIQIRPAGVRAIVPAVLVTK
jgi:hypothetical protein